MVKNNRIQGAKLISLVIPLLLSLFVGCKKNIENDDVLVVCSPHPVEFISVLVQNFENETGIEVRVIPQGTGGILENVRKSFTDNSLMQKTGAKTHDTYCDVVWGGSLSTVIPDADLFEPYTSVNEPFFDEVYKNTEGNLTRFSDIPSVLMINKNLLGDIPVAGYGDLLNPLLKGKIAFADPKKSSSSWEHLFNMVTAMGKENGGDAGWTYVKQLCINLDGKLLDGSKAVYEGVSAGDYAVGLTFEEGGANYAETDSNIKLVYMQEGVVFTPDGIYIVKGTAHRKKAEQFVDYLTGKDVQTYISQVLNRRSVRCDVEIKPSLLSKKQIKVIALDYGYAASKKDSSIARFGTIYNNVQQSNIGYSTIK